MLQTPPSAQRIRLRPERPWQEHLELYNELFADPAVADALWPGTRHGLRAERRGAEILAEDIRHWQRESFGPWIFFEATTGSFVGRSGLRRTTVRGRACVELLYVVRPEFWGGGYATEMASIAVAHARTLRLDEVVGFTATSNRASRRVLEKVGLRFEAIFEHAGLPHWLGRWPERDRSSVSANPR
jgi:RimJ/RimL family protein N-acetyltransferase